MAINGNSWQRWILGIVAGLAAYGVLGTIRMGNAQSTAEAKLESLESRQDRQEQAVERGLEKIDTKLDKIIDAVGNLKSEDAKYHHDHNPR